MSLNKDLDTKNGCFAFGFPNQQAILKKTFCAARIMSMRGGESAKDDQRKAAHSRGNQLFVETRRCMRLGQKFQSLVKFPETCRTLSTLQGNHQIRVANNAVPM